MSIKYFAGFAGRKQAVIVYINTVFLREVKWLPDRILAKTAAPYLEMNILYFANHLRGPSNAGGARSWHQVRRLISDAHVTAIIPRIDPLTDEQAMPDPFSEDGDVEVILAPSFRAQRSSLIGRVIYAISCVLGQMVVTFRQSRPDIVVAMSAPITSAVIPMLYSKLRKIPLVLDVRDIPLEVAQEINYIKTRVIVRSLAWMESLIMKSADGIVVVSKEMFPFLMAKGVGKEKLYYMPIGYDDFPEPATKQVESERHELENVFENPADVLVLYSGTLGHIMDVETVLKSAEILRSEKNIGFVIVGSGQKLSEYKSFVSEKMLNVHFLGRVPKERVHVICRAVDICLFPIHGGSAVGSMLGNKIFDYMGAGKCVIYSGPEGAVSNLISDSDCGILCDQRDAPQLAARIKHLAAETDERARLGRNGRTHVVKTMTALISANALADLLVKIVGTNK